LKGRRWKIAGLVAAAILVAAGPFAVVAYLRASKTGPSLDSPDGSLTAQLAYGKPGQKLCRLIVVRKHDGQKIADTVCHSPGTERARIVWLPDGGAVGVVTQERRVLGLLRLKPSVFDLANEEVAERLLAEMK